PRPLLLDLLREHLAVLEPEGFNMVPRLAGRHGADGDHFLAAGKERDIVDPLLTDLVVPHDLAGVVDHNDVRVAEGSDGADDDLLAVVGDVEASDPSPRQRPDAPRVPARRPGWFGLLSEKRDARDTSEQASHEDWSHVRILSLPFEVRV